MDRFALSKTSALWLAVALVFLSLCKAMAKDNGRAAFLAAHKKCKQQGYVSQPFRLHCIGRMIAKKDGKYWVLLGWYGDGGDPAPKKNIYMQMKKHGMNYSSFAKCKATEQSMSKELIRLTGEYRANIRYYMQCVRVDSRTVQYVGD